MSGQLLRRRWHAGLRTRPMSTVIEALTALLLWENDPRRPLTESQALELAISFRMALSQMLGGAGSESQWASCVCSLNIALVLAESGYGRDCIEHFNAALEGAFRSQRRAGRVGRWGFDGDAIAAVQLAFELHEQQLTLASKADIAEAVREVHARMARGQVFTEGEA